MDNPKKFYDNLGLIVAMGKNREIGCDQKVLSMKKKD